MFVLIAVLSILSMLFVGDHFGGVPGITQGAPLSLVWRRHEPHRASSSSTSSVALGPVAVVLEMRVGGCRQARARPRLSGPAP